MNLLSRLPELLPAPIQDFLKLSVHLGFTPVLVGGAVRDLANGSEEIFDWDFELHNSEGSETRWQALLSALRTGHQLTPQSHHVVKALHPATRIEWQFAPPRIEIYPQRDAYGHGDFETKVTWKLPFSEAVNRRDFTLNAMGASWDGRAWTLLDPLNGLAHLKAGELHPCDVDHFRKDPVRFLRAHRFALKYGWKFSPILREALEQMDLAFLTAHYMSEESRKSRAPFLFWNHLQSQQSLPAKFQGGILSPNKLEETYSRHLGAFGHSNAMLAAVFAAGEGWHLLLPLAGKGESETTVWRLRRDYILSLSGKVVEDFIKVDEELFRQESFATLCHLVRPPLAWFQLAWAKEVLTEQGLLWITEKPWDDKIDVRSFPPQERGARKVMAWVRA
jgi:hypothetical protein